MQRHISEYELLWVLKFVEGPHNFTTEIAIFGRLRGIYFGKIRFFGKFL
jgi:hypothetical protein